MKSILGIALILLSGSLLFAAEKSKETPAQTEKEKLIISRETLRIKTVIAMREYTANSDALKMLLTDLESKNPSKAAKADYLKEFDNIFGKVKECEKKLAASMAAYDAAVTAEARFISDGKAAADTP